MPQASVEKSYFTFQNGLVTDASPLGYPEETTQDEANYELLRDGSRRRRRGLNTEASGNTTTLCDTLATNDKVSSFTWRNAGATGDNFIVVQAGHCLIFYQDETTISSEVDPHQIDLTLYKVSGKTDSDISSNPISFAVGHHRKLAVVGRYIEPFYISWDGTDFTTTQILIQERDFIGVDDSVNINTQPTTLSDAHKYNLNLRGWKPANITTYYTDKSKYPAKNMWPWKGYHRTHGANVAEEDGTWSFDSDKMAAELFGDASAAMGHLIINPFNTTTTGLVSSTLTITGMTFVSSDTKIEVTANSHGYSNGNSVTIQGSLYIISDPVYPVYYYISLDGTYTISNVTTNTFEITYGKPTDFVSFVNLGILYLSTVNEVVTNPSPYVTSERPQIVAWFAGRLWFTGIQATELSDKIYFSQIIENPTQFGKCYQAADPTDPFHNELVPNDGGTFVISDMGLVKGARVFNDSLLLFTTRGVWQIQGDREGFRADGYGIRKLSDYSCTSIYSVAATADKVFWSGDEGIYALFQDPQTGYLTAQSIIKERLQSFWNNLTESQQETVKSSYDRAQERLYILYRSSSEYNTNQYDSCLICNLFTGAFYKLKFPTSTASYITHIHSITTTEEGESNKNIKFFVQTETRTKMKVCDLDQTNFVDWDSTQQIPYMVTAYDNLKDFHRFKQAPVIHVYCKKTETGYTESGTDLIPINESSVLLRPIWDWADATSSGKYGPQYQVYRHRRYYQPSGSSDPFQDGQPIVVTRNKLRGRGRVLHLRFDGEASKDSHILGWTLSYKATRKV